MTTQDTPDKSLDQMTADMKQLEELVAKMEMLPAHGPEADTEDLYPFVGTIDEALRCFVFEHMASSDIDGETLVKNMERVYQWISNGVTVSPPPAPLRKKYMKVIEGSKEKPSEQPKPPQPAPSAS